MYPKYMAITSCDDGLMIQSNVQVSHTIYISAWPSFWHQVIQCLKRKFARFPSCASIHQTHCFFVCADPRHWSHK